MPWLVEKKIKTVWLLPHEAVGIDFFNENCNR
jgi:hypothetical protein